MHNKREELDLHNVENGPVTSFIYFLDHVNDEIGKGCRDYTNQNLVGDSETFNNLLGNLSASSNYKIDIFMVAPALTITIIFHCWC